MKNKFFNNLLLTVLSLGFIGCEDYVDYALKTPIGIPFVKGNRLFDQLR
jgi:hypothetical protein